MENSKSTQWDEETKRAVALFDKLQPAAQDMVLALAEAMLQQQRREEAERYKAQRMAIRYSIVSEMWEGEEAVGKAWIAKYSDSPQALVGIGYVAGIAQGKRLERARQRQRAAKAQQGASSPSQPRADGEYAPRPGQPHRGR